MKKAFFVVGVLLAAGVAFYFLFFPTYIDRKWNYGFAQPPYKVSSQAENLHKALFIADLHNDSLMWDRDLLQKNTRGYIDLPRMQEGNLALQTFTAVTKVSRGRNIDKNDGELTDSITLLAISQLWPVRTWSSVKERALYLASKLDGFAERSNGKLIIIKSREDLRQFVEDRKKEPDLTGAVLGLEGAHVLEGNPRNIEALYDAGYRTIGLAHFSDNEMAGSQQGVSRGGLTEKGREMLQLVESKGMIIDLSHSSSKTIDDVLRLSSRPVMVSHTGVKGTLDNNRNLSDDQLRAIAANGGLIGIGFWEEAIGPITDLKATVRALKHAVKIAGIDSIAFGSDSDGSVPMPFEASGLVLLTDALINEGFSDTEIRKIMGENVASFYMTMLP